MKPGMYAVAVMRDENGNDAPELDVFDLRRNGVGASNDAKGFFGPPKLEDARFQYKGGPLRIAIKMSYHTAK